MNQIEPELPVCVDAVGTAQSGFAERVFTFITVPNHLNVFLHKDQFVNKADSFKLKPGHQLTFDIVKTDKGNQARRTRITGEPSLSEVQSGVVAEWPWDYGYIYVGGHKVRARASQIEGAKYLRAGDRVNVCLDETGRYVVSITPTKLWDEKGLSAYEVELDMGIPNQWISFLRELAFEERWDTKGRDESAILRSYFKNTYLRQRELQGHIIVDEDRMGWNTGLFDHNGDDIVAEFERKRNTSSEPAWLWTRFLTVADKRASSWRDARRAKYWDEPADLIYDTDKGIPTVQSEHIGEKVEERFPDYMHSYQRQDLVRAVQEATRDAVKRVIQSYKTAIPQFYRSASGAGKGSIQLLLPLRFPGHLRPSLALAVRRDGDAYYAGTVLKIEWAYTYARLLAKPDTEWLDPFDPTVKSA